jgi:hypothetical protein
MSSAVPDAAPGAPGWFDVGCVAEDGARHKVPLADVAVIRFAAMLPFRRFKPREGQRHLPRRWWLAADGRHAGYQSWLERGQMMWLGWDQSVTGIASQPFRLSWTSGEGSVQGQVTGYAAERADAPALVVDCRRSGANPGPG